MSWPRMLAYITGTVDGELLLRNEYLLAENQILRQQINGRLRLTDSQRWTLAEIGKRLGAEGLAQVATAVKPETILAWYRRLVAQKFDGSNKPKGPGRPRTAAELEQLVVQMAQDNPSWGYDRIVGALANLGHELSDETVGNILKRHGIPPAPERQHKTSWKQFIRTHLEVLAATDFFTSEVWTPWGLSTIYVLFFIRLQSRQVHIAGMTSSPTEAWMKQVARNVTMNEVGFLSGCRYVLHDRDTKFSAGFGQVLESAGVKPVRLPAHSPNLNAIAERWILSAKSECLSQMILFGERSLRQVVSEYVEHYHRERNHQGRGNVLLFPSPEDQAQSRGQVVCRERLGGLLKYYYREAA